MKNMNEVNDQVMGEQAGAENQVKNNGAGGMTVSAKRQTAEPSIIKVWNTHRQVLVKPYLHMF